jgi:hypothetical protein
VQVYAHLPRRSVVDASHVADTFVLSFVGELDLRFASAAKQATIAALPDTRPDDVRLTLNLSGLTSCDASDIRTRSSSSSRSSTTAAADAPKLDSPLPPELLTQPGHPSP